jgi:uncharacterized membrane protein YqiK
MIDLGPAAIVGALLMLALLGGLVASMRLYRQVEPNHALVISPTSGEPRVIYTGALVFPVLHHAEEISLVPHTITLERRGPRGVLCRDSIRVDLRATFRVQINRTREDILKVAQTLGCSRAGDPKVVQEIFEARFSGAIETAARSYTFRDLLDRRLQFADEIREVIGTDLQGFVVDDVTIDQLDHTPIDQLDPNNLPDAEGIRKLTEEIAEKELRTNELRNRMEQQLREQNLAAAEAITRIETETARHKARADQEIAQYKAHAEEEAARLKKG